VVALFGTLDQTSAARMMVTLRDCLADAPTVLLLDVEHLVVSSESAFAQLPALASEAESWPGARIGLCGLSPSVAALASSVAHDGELDIYPTVDLGAEAARRVPVSPRRSVTLLPDPNAPARSRQFAVETCNQWGIDRVANLAELIASELVTNAVVHAGTPIDVTLWLTDDTLNIAVRDGDPRPMYRPSMTGPGPVIEEHGRGLLLLDAMADIWGCNSTADGKVVWAIIGVAKSRQP
jgi:anti-sigma regulatory factor (Ser/Thr protein kinase)/anti-anti-sigma regulatory factor